MDPSDSSRGDGGPLHRAVERLPPDIRDVVRLTILKRWSDGQVAEELGLDIEEVRRRRIQGEKQLASDFDFDDLKRRLR